MPWLFWEQFCELPEDIFLNLAFAGALVSLASVLMDHLIDGQAEQSEATAALRKIMLQYGVSLLHNYYPWKDPFWERFKHLHRLHLRSLAIESSLQSQPKFLPKADFDVMVEGKASPVMITLVAMSIAAGCQEIIPSLENSLYRLAIAGQLHDDVLDWRQDLEAHHLTYFLTQFLTLADDGFYKPLSSEVIMAHA